MTLAPAGRVRLLGARASELAGLAMVFLLFTRLPDLYRPRQWPISLNQLIVVLVACCLVLRGHRPRLDRGLGLMLLYGAAIALSALPAVNRVAVLSSLAAYLHDVVVVLILLNLVTSWSGLRLMTWTLVAAGATAAGLGLVHAFTGSDLGGLSSVDVGNLAGDEAGYRLAGTIGNSNAFAQMLVCVVPLALYRAWAEPRPRFRLLALAATALISAVVVWTYSRSGGVALVLVLGLALAFRKFERRYVLTAGVVVGLALLTAPRPYWDRLVVTQEYLVGSAATRLGSGGAVQTAAAPADPAPVALEPVVVTEPLARAEPVRDNGSLPERVDLLRVGALVFLEHPLVGVGKGNYLSLFPSYAARVNPSLVRDPKVVHNTPLQILADTGLVGLACFAALVVVVVAGLRGARRRCDRAGLRTEALLLEPVELGVYAYLVTSLFASDDFPRYLWLLLGLAMAGRQIALPSSSARSCRRS